VREGAAFAVTPADAAMGFPGWEIDTRKVPPGRTINAAIATIIGTIQSVFRPVEPGDIAEADHT